MKIFSIKTAQTLLFLITVFFSCSTSLLRLLDRGDAGVDDYLYFPERKISKSINPYKVNYDLINNAEETLKSIFHTQSIPDFIETTKTQSLLIIKNNSIIFEAYGKGYDKNSIVTSFSVAKSFVSAMIGQLIAEGKIQDIKQPITDFIPELMERDKRFSSISIRDLLTMSSGISYEEFPNFRADNIETYYNPNLRKLALENTEIESLANIKFHYNNYHPLLLGLIIERITGGTVSSYLEETIWKPMGSEFEASWSLDSKESLFEKMESGLNARAIDFARFGCLYRDFGIINGAQVIPKNWISESTSDSHLGNSKFYDDPFGRKIQSVKNGGYYGYFWYGLTRKDYPRDDFYAAGNKSEIIYISPKSNLVIVRFGAEDGINFWEWISGFYDFSTQNE